MAKYKLKNNKKKFDLGGGMSTPEGTFDSNGKKVAGPNGQPLEGGMSATQGLGYAQAGLGAVSAYQNSGSAAQGLKSGIDGVAGIATPWYAYAKMASDAGRSMIPKDENGQITNPNMRSADALMKPVHEQVIDQVDNKQYGDAALSAFVPGYSAIRTNQDKDFKYKMGGELTEYSGPSHKQGGINFGKIQTEGGETESNGIVNSISYAFNKMMAKGLSMAGIDIGKHIGRTPAEASKIEDKRYPRENDVYTNNSLKKEEEQGRGKFAVENASKLIGSMVNPDAQTAKYGGNIKKFTDGGGMFTLDPNRFGQQSNLDFNSPYSNLNQKQFNLDPENDQRVAGYNPYQNQLKPFSIDQNNRFNNLKTTDEYKNYDEQTPESSAMNIVGDFGPDKEPKTNNFDPNSLYNVGNFLGSAYDIGRGLKGGDSVNFDRVSPNTINYTSSKNEALRSNNQTYKDMSNTLKNVNSSSMYQNLKFQSAGKKYEADSKVINEFDTKQKNENAGIVNQSKYFNAQVQKQETDARQQEKDIVSNTLQAGLTGFGNSLAGTGRDKALNVSQEDAKRYIGTGDFKPATDKSGKEIKNRYMYNGVMYNQFGSKVKE